MLLVDELRIEEAQGFGYDPSFALIQLNVATNHLIKLIRWPAERSFRNIKCNLLRLPKAAISVCEATVVYPPEQTVLKRRHV